MMMDTLEVERKQIILCCPARKYISPEAGVSPCKRAGHIYFRAGQQSGRNIQVSVTMSRSL
jgi:hypothetical protein